VTNDRLKVEISIDKQIRAYVDGTWVDNLGDVIVGTPIYYQFIVSNTGDLDLADVTVTDPILGELLYSDPAHVFCTIPVLLVGESVTCPVPPVGPTPALFTGEGETFTNTATAYGCAVADPSVCDDDEDSASYTGLYWAFTPGFWKNHADDTSDKYPWKWTDYSPDVLVGTVFDSEFLQDRPRGDAQTFAEKTLVGALSLKGGRGIEGAKGNLLRAAVAALLNASFHEQQHCNGGCTVGPNGELIGPDGLVLYPYTSQGVIDAVNFELDPANHDDELDHQADMLKLAAELDSYNNGIEYIDWEDPKKFPPTP
jgi:uncharacterized repeat protein (TIGR01451 family)